MVKEDSTEERDLKLDLKMHKTQTRKAGEGCAGEKSGISSDGGRRTVGRVKGCVEKLEDKIKGEVV